MRTALAVLAALAGTALAAPVAEPTSFIKRQVPDVCPDRLSCLEFCLEKKVISSDRTVDFGSCLVTKDQVYCTQFNATNYEKIRVQEFDCTSENLVNLSDSETAIGSPARNESDHTRAETMLSRPVRSTEETETSGQPTQDQNTKERSPEDRERQKSAIDEMEEPFKSSVDPHIKGLKAPCSRKTFLCKVKINASVLRDMILGCDHKVGVFGYQQCSLRPQDMRKPRKKGKGKAKTSA
ncbi:hypothetical protein CP532_5770 [Ophiocordyceps camponoti-leonardi (nom. inval.)]|nr:hypothetical protein CP532_5770 [Ophiocordyceps camponoti-leonardi (nom. inval.)]